MPLPVQQLEIKKMPSPAPDGKTDISIRFNDSRLKQLDRLCDANHRTRREVLEILIYEAAEELRADRTARIIY